MATGRIQVAPGQVIQSGQWGNLVWDQSVQDFLSAADRDNQFPAPKPGAVCYLEDQQLWLGRKGNTWVPLPGQAWGQIRSWSHVCADARIDILDFSGASVAGYFTRNADGTVNVLRAGIWSITNSITNSVGTGTVGAVNFAISGPPGVLVTLTGGTAGGNAVESSVSWTGPLAANDKITCQIYPRFAGTQPLRSSFAFIAAT